MVALFTYIRISHKELFITNSNLHLTQQVCSAACFVCSTCFFDKQETTANYLLNSKQMNEWWQLAIYDSSISGAAEIITAKTVISWNLWGWVHWNDLFIDYANFVNLQYFNKHHLWQCYLFSRICDQELWRLLEIADG